MARLDKEVIVRLREYLETNLDNMFIPNWLINGYESKSHAIEFVIESITTSKSIKEAGL